MHYCYGLSVINSHLLRGAGADPHRPVGGRPVLLGAVPAPRGHLLRRRAVHVRPARPGRLRRDATCRTCATSPRPAAGWRPTGCARYAALGRRDGWDLFVMYGQTEATARMAYLPPRPGRVATRRRSACRSRADRSGSSRAGRPGPGRRRAGLRRTQRDARVRRSAGRPGLGRTVDELRTGDLARRSADGLYEIVGRRSRFAKILGLRVDPQQVEDLLDRHGITAVLRRRRRRAARRVVGDDAATPVDAPAASASAFGLPARAVRVSPSPSCPGWPTASPTTPPSGRWPRRAEPAGPAPTSSTGAGRPARAVRRGPGPTDVTEDEQLRQPRRRLAVLCGDVAPAGAGAGPPAGRLAHHADPRPAPGRAAGRPRRRPGRTARRWTPASPCAPSRSCSSSAPTSQLLRHLRRRAPAARRGRLQLRPLPPHRRAAPRPGPRHLRAASRRIAAAERRLDRRWCTCSPTTTAAPTCSCSTSSSGRATARTMALLVHRGARLHPASPWPPCWPCPRCDRLERRYPFALPLAVAGARPGHPLRPARPEPGRPAARRSRCSGCSPSAGPPPRRPPCWQRAAVTRRGRGHGARASSATRAARPSWWPACSLLIWVPACPSLRLLNRLAGVLAGASLYIYLTHWQVFPHLDHIPAARPGRLARRGHRVRGGGAPPHRWCAGGFDQVRRRPVGDQARRRQVSTSPSPCSITVPAMTRRRVGARRRMPKAGASGCPRPG